LKINIDGKSLDDAKLIVEEMKKKVRYPEIVRPTNAVRFALSELAYQIRKGKKDFK
jgi:hypothetical protein